MQGQKTDADKGLAQQPFSYWLIRGGCSKELVRLDRSQAPQLRDSIFIDKTKRERGTLKAGRAGQGRAGFLKTKTHRWSRQVGGRKKKGGENRRRRSGQRQEIKMRSEGRSEEKEIKALDRRNPCFGSSNEMVCGHVMGAGVALSACEACPFVCHAASRASGLTCLVWSTASER